MLRKFGSALLLALVTAVGASAGDLSLVDAVTNGDEAAVRAALRRPGVNVNATEADGSTALHYAADRGEVRLVDALIAAGANVKAQNRYGVTPLSVAVERGSAAVVERLLKAGADPNTTTAGGETALMTASRAGDPALVKVLLARGANVNAKENTRAQTALMWAAIEGQADAMKVLIEAGADMRARSNEVEYKNIFGALTTTETQGLETDSKMIRFTPLLFAVRAGHLDAVKVLLDAGADVNEKLPDGLNGVILAIINGHFELAAYLLDRGADPNAADAGWTALHQVARSRSLTVGQVPHPVATGTLSTLDLAKKLIAMGAKVNARMTGDSMRADGYRTQLNRIGATPYLLAAKGVDHQLMRLLLANGADPMLTNDHAMRPLQLTAGVALHATGEDSGTLEDAFEAFKVAYSVDQDVNYKDKRGHTALHGAARRGSLEIARFLVEHGAKLDVTIKREDFIGQAYSTKGVLWTPLTIALGRGKDGVPLFIGAERFPDVASYLYLEMKTRGLSFENEDPWSIDWVRGLTGEMPASTASAAK